MTTKHRTRRGKASHRKKWPRQGAQTDTNSPPNIPTRGGAAFLWQVDPDTPLEELAEKYTEWRRSR